MYHTTAVIKSVSLLAAVASEVTLALPQSGGIPAFPPVKCPKITSQKNVNGARWQTGVSVAGGNSITTSETHSVGTTWTVGGNAGVSIGSIISLGMSTSVATTVTDSMGEAGNLNCPAGGWFCSVIVTPGMLEVNGTIYSQSACSGSGVVKLGTVGPYSVKIPRKDSGGNPIFTPEVCVCANGPNATAAGAPQTKCISDCTIPSGS